MKSYSAKITRSPKGFGNEILNHLIDGDFTNVSDEEEDILQRDANSSKEDGESPRKGDNREPNWVQIQQVEI